MTHPVTLLRIVEFSAAHRYSRADWTDEENQRAFGSQVNLHGHNYRVEVAVQGPLNPLTGFVTDLMALDAAIDALVITPLHNRVLNDEIPEIRSGAMQPSTESLALWIGGRLASQIEKPASLVSVRVWESGTLGAEAHFSRDAGHDINFGMRSDLPE